MGDRIETLATYVGDMHALEKHLLEAFERQLSLTEDNSDAHTVVQQLVSTTQNHITALEQRQESLGHAGKSATDAVKTALSGLLGVAAGAIDAVRPQSISKALRDSYTATNHAVVGYVMLQTAGVALNDQETAQLAERHLQDAVKNAQAIASAIPALVVHDLSDDVSDVNQTAASTVNQELSHLYS